MITQEKTIDYFQTESNGMVLRGMKHSSNLDAKKQGIVIIVHGYFSSNKIGPHRLYVQIANVLAELGYDAYRFDLSGMGESDGLIEDATYESHLKDLKEIILTLYKTSKQPIILVGHCMGAELAIQATIDLPTIIKRSLLLAPFFSNKRIMEKVFGIESLDRLSENGYTYRKGIFVSGSFFRSNTTDINFLSKLATTRDKLSCIIAEADELVPFEDSKKIFSAANLQPIAIKGADHNFLETRQILLEKIIEVFKNTQNQQGIIEKIV